MPGRSAPPHTPDEAAQYITAMCTAEPNGPFAIPLDGQVVGSIGVFRQQSIHLRTGELGCYIAEPYWGQAVGPRR